MVKPFLTKSQLFVKNSESGFLILRARLAFTELRQTFIKVLIIYRFDLEFYIYIKTDISDYTIGKILSQLTLDNLASNIWWFFFLER